MTNSERAPIEPGTEPLEKLFHEPNRLAIMSALCAADGPVAFTDLKSACGLTDGNLNRHLKALEDAGAIRVQKTFVHRRPRTIIALTGRGLDRFRQYLDALEALLDAARKTIPEIRKRRPALLGRTVQA